MSPRLVHSTTRYFLPLLHDRDIENVMMNGHSLLLSKGQKLPSRSPSSWLTPSSSTLKQPASQSHWVIRFWARCSGSTGIKCRHPTQVNLGFPSFWSLLAVRLWAGFLSSLSLPRLCVFRAHEGFKGEIPVGVQSNPAPRK